MNGQTTLTGFDSFESIAILLGLIHDYWLPLLAAIAFFVSSLFRSAQSPTPTNLDAGEGSRRSGLFDSNELPFYLWALTASLANIRGITIVSGTYHRIWEVFLGLGLALIALTLVVGLEAASSLLQNRSSVRSQWPLRLSGTKVLITAAVMVDFVLSLFFILYHLEMGRGT
jgi:hypothetical protein